MSLANRLSGLISNYFDKKGIADITQLSSDEQVSYDKWQEILTAEVTLENVSTFIGEQQKTLAKELQAAVKQGEDRKALLITARIENYNDLINLIAAPDRNREQLEIHLTNLIKHG